MPSGDERARWWLDQRVGPDNRACRLLGGWLRRQLSERPKTLVERQTLLAYPLDDPELVAVLLPNPNVWNEPSMCPPPESGWADSQEPRRLWQTHEPVRVVLLVIVH